MNPAPRSVWDTVLTVVAILIAITGLLCLAAFIAVLVAFSHYGSNK